MRRIASTVIVCVILLTSVAGCSFLGLGKKEPIAESYDPIAVDPSSQGYAYQPPLPADTGMTASSYGGGRYHTVQSKETLYSISRQYYNDHTRWKDIYAANRTEISDPNKIRVGQRLVIP